MSQYSGFILLVIIGAGLMFIGDKLRLGNPEAKIRKFEIDCVIFVVGMGMIVWGGGNIIGLLIKYFC
ncbi:MAG: hypothetical protein WC499_01785 [Patescibacteria group bacterium]